MTIPQITAMTIVVAMAAILIYKVITDYKDVKHVILSLVVEADKRWVEKGANGLKYSYVIGQLKAWIPIYIRPFFPDSVLNVMIDTAIDYMKVQLREDAPEKKLE